MVVKMLLRGLNKDADLPVLRVKRIKGERVHDLESNSQKGHDTVYVADLTRQKDLHAKRIVEAKNLKKHLAFQRKKGQPAKSKKHSDLYTDENPKRNNSRTRIQRR